MVSLVFHDRIVSVIVNSLVVHCLFHTSKPSFSPSTDHLVQEYCSITWMGYQVRWRCCWRVEIWSTLLIRCYSLLLVSTFLPNSVCQHLRGTVCSNGCAMYFVIVRYTVRDVTMCILQRGEPYDLMLLVRPFMLDKKRAGPVTCPWACQSKQHRIWSRSACQFLFPLSHKGQWFRNRGRLSLTLWNSIIMKISTCCHKHCSVLVTSVT